MEDLILGAGKEILGVYVLGPVCIAICGVAILLDRRNTKLQEANAALQERLLVTTKEVAVAGEKFRVLSEELVGQWKDAMELLRDRGKS